MEFSFDFKMTEENKKIIEEILKQKGVKHYVLETKDKEKLDLVEYKDYKELEKEKQELIDYLKEKIYTIEPKGCVINYNCEYDSEEDYVKGMKEKSKLETLKEILSKIEKR